MEPNPYPLVNFTANIPQFGNQSWATNADFRWSSYSGLHKAANKSLTWIFPDFENFKGFRLDPYDLTYFNSDEDNNGNVDVNDMIWENRGPLAFGIVGLLLAFTLSLIGIGWCVLQCCNCCCSSKKSKLRADKDKSKKRNMTKIVCGVLMIVWRVLFVTFLIALFVSNEQFRDAIDELPKDVDNGVVDTETFIDLTQKQIDAVFQTSFNDLADVLNKIIEDNIPPVPGPDVTESFKGAFKTLFDLKSTAELRSPVENLEQALNSLQLNLESPRLVPIDELPRLIEETRLELRANAKSLTDALEEVPITQTREDIKDIEKEFDRAKGPAYHSINGLNLFLLLIVVALTVGAILGLFSKTARYGSTTINCALFTIFLTTWIIWIFALGVFMLAGGLMVVLPGAFDNVASNGSLVQPQTRAAGDYVVPGYAAILQNCKNSSSAYVTFDLGQVYNISDIQSLVNKLEIDPDTPRLNSQIASVSKHLKDVKTISSRLSSSIAEQTSRSLQIQTLDSEVSVILSAASSVRDRRSAAEEVKKHVTHYADFVYTEVLENVGNCEPLYNVLTSTLHVFSYKVGSPIGAYWWSLNFMLLLLYPIVITAIVTQGL